ncbi:unnamed protein product [Strongylus vulgaris]|uniref:Reverse transcriptase RNase H-like domain-containing protein n=1 Tax=Strongylus vulgaris TaxID=40348 RepID=A0A3P7J445_STRVU|nr:unnamed protein product [Strongylus vulgaris]
MGLRKQFAMHRSLTAGERNYGQIEKEELALIFAVRKYHRYMYGRRFKLTHKSQTAVTEFLVPVYTQ